MAKLRSSSCGPLVQGMMLIALLLLPSIQASLEQAMDVIKEAGDRLKEASEQLGKEVVGNKEKVTETGVNMALAELAKKDGWKEFSTGARKGIKFHKKWCKAQRWMYKLGGSSFVDALAADLGRLGDLAWKLRTFSYEVTSEAGVNVCWFQEDVPAAGTRATTTLVPGRYPNDGRYYVQITGIRVGQGPVVWTKLNLPPPAYLSTVQPYTYIESNLYGSLRAAVVDQMKVLNPGVNPALPLFTDKLPPLAADKLCYAAAGLSVPAPPIAIVLDSNNVMEGGADYTLLWYYTDSNLWCCMGIFPATTGQPPVLGTMIQSGKTMTIDLAAARGLGTLTFTTTS